MSYVGFGFESEETRVNFLKKSSNSVAAIKPKFVIDVGTKKEERGFMLPPHRPLEP